MAIPFYYNPATNELELTADPSPLRDSLGTRFGLNEISIARETLSPTKSYIEDRVDMKPGGIVEPGVTNYATTANLLKADQDLLQKLISEANTGNKYTTVEDINELYYKAKGVDRGATTYKYASGEVRPSRTLSVKANPIFNTLETRGDKIEKVLKEMLMDKNSLTKPWRSVLMDKTGIDTYKTIAKLLPDSLTFQAIAPEAKFLGTGMGGYKEMYVDMPFAEQLKIAAIQMEGKPIFTGLSKNKVRLMSPNYTVMKIALENWHANKGKGSIQFFDEKGDKITWGEKKEFPIHKSSFSYKGEIYNYEKLLEPGVAKKVFPQVFKVQAAIQKLSNKEVDNPFIKGEKINFKDLVKEIQVRGYKWSPKGTIQLLHGIEGVKNEPFTNLSFSTKDINLIENAINRSSNSQEFKKAAINELYKDLKGLGDDEISEHIITRQTGLAEKIVSGEKILSVTQQKEKIFQIIKNLPKIELDKIATAVGCKTPAKKSEGGRIGFGAGSVGMLACIDAKWEKNQQGFFRKTFNIASKGLDQVWKYAAPFFLPAVQVARGRLEHFKHPTKPDMYWDMIMAHEAVKKLGLDKVALSQLKNASLLKKADIIGKLVLAFPGSKPLKFLASKIGWPGVIATETLSSVGAVKSELDLVKEYASKNNIPYEDARLAYYASGSAFDKSSGSLRASLFSKLVGGSTLMAHALQKRNNPEFQELGKNVYQYVKENKDKKVIEEKVELPHGTGSVDWALDVKARMKEKEPQHHAALGSFSMGGIASLIK